MCSAIHVHCHRPHRHQRKTIFYRKTFGSGSDCSQAMLHNAALAVVRCLSVWVSVTFVYCVKTAKDLAIVNATECE